MKPKSYELLGQSHSAVYGEARSKRLDELAVEANTHHMQAQVAWRGFSSHARSAGEALLHAKRILGHRSKWRKWRIKNFNGSREKCNQYIRVARFWDHPLIVEAREQDTVHGVEGFLALLRKKRQKKDQPAEEGKWFCDQLRKYFAATIQKMPPKILEMYFSDYHKIFDELVRPYLKAEARKARSDTDNSEQTNCTFTRRPRSKRERREERINHALQFGQE